MAASDSIPNPRFAVILPTTHRSPSWVIVSEHNVDEWQTAGLAPLPGRPGLFAYGFIPPRLFAAVKARFLALSDRRQSRGVQRIEE